MIQTTERMCACIRESAEMKKYGGKVQLIIQTKLKRARVYKKNAKKSVGVITEVGLSTTT